MKTRSYRCGQSDVCNTRDNKQIKDENRNSTSGFSHSQINQYRVPCDIFYFSFFAILNKSLLFCPLLISCRHRVASQL